MAFNALHTALETAVNTLLAAGLCAEIDLVMSPRFELAGNTIHGADYHVACIRTAQPAPPSSVRVTFSTPTHREDGSELRVEDILGYEFEFTDGCVSGRTVTADGLVSAPATYCYTRQEL